MNPSCVTAVAVPVDLDDILPLIRGYQAYYSITNVDDIQTRAFFGSVITSPAEGFIIVARIEREAVGFATGYITRSGYLARRLVHMGDLFVDPQYRNRGVGRTLIKAVAVEAKKLGLQTVRWLTSSTNFEAHRFYDSLGAAPSEHRLYVWDVSGSLGD